MANILQQYGIKEVADVCFYKLNSDGTKNLALYLDTLKVSSIEQTAEEVEARGGKGNPPLIVWDYGKEITLTIEDALYSPQSMAIMFGADNKGKNNIETVTGITKTKRVVAKAKSIGGPVTIDETWLPEGAEIIEYYMSDEAGKPLKSYTKDKFKDVSLKSGDVVYIQYTYSELKGTKINIDADSFPGTYEIVGDTYARSAVTGEDTFYQFRIPKAKMNADQTITLEAEGDPTVFNMTLRVLRDDDGRMMELTQYEALPDAAAGEAEEISLNSFS